MHTIKFSILLLPLFFAQSLLAQSIQGNLSSLSSDTIKKKIVDNAKYRIYYSLVFARDSTKPERKIKGQTVLLVGSRYSAFVDYYSLRSDSLLDAMTKQNESSVSILSQVLPIGRMVKFKPRILKNYPQSNSYLFQQTIASTNHYEYADTDIHLQWTLDEEEKTILDYVCKKATCSYRGRDYTAWYAPEIAMTEGPYIFSGLPGLILEISDAADNYHFTINGFEQAKDYDPIYLRTKNIVKSSRNEVRKMIENAAKDPESMLKNMSVQIRDTKTGQMPSIAPRPHNPIEID
jgi:GLPGLI family protein